MRIKITLASCSKGAIDFNYQQQIQGLIYKGFLAKSNPEYASSLHKHGYVYERDKWFKLFVFSGIIFDKPIKVIGSNRSNSSSSFNGLNGLNGLNCLNGFLFHASPSNPFTFSFSFQIASPVNEFIQHLIDGIFRQGHEIELGTQCLNVHRVETLPDPLVGLNDLNSLNGLNCCNCLNCLNGLNCWRGLNDLIEL